MSQMQRLLLIANTSTASKAYSLAKEAGATGGTILYGEGTSQNQLLKLLGFDDVRKEILLILAPHERAAIIAEELADKLELSKPGQGILALQSVINCYGIKELSDCKSCEGEKVQSKYILINVIVDQELSREVIDTATLAGARGATIMQGRGAGTQITQSIFNIPIMPEKDIILMLMTEEGSQPIIDAILNTIGIDKPGKGIIFTQPVDSVYGMSE